MEAQTLENIKAKVLAVVCCNKGPTDENQRGLEEASTPLTLGKQKATSRVGHKYFMVEEAMHGDFFIFNSFVLFDQLLIVNALVSPPQPPLLSCFYLYAGLILSEYLPDFSKFSTFVATYKNFISMDALILSYSNSGSLISCFV